MYILVRFLVSDVVGYNDSMSSLVVRSSDGLEALLASSVPNLKFDFLSINIDSLDLTVINYCRGKYVHGLNEVSRAAVSVSVGQLGASLSLHPLISFSLYFFVFRSFFCLFLFVSIITLHFHVLQILIYHLTSRI